MKSSFNTTIKVLNKFYALQKRIDKAGKDWNDCDSFNREACEVYFALPQGSEDHARPSFGLERLRA